MEFTDKVVIVTGASSGIGAATAIHFAKLGASVSMVGRNEQNLQAIAKQITDAKGKEPLLIKADMNNEADVERIVQETLGKFNKLDVLVNCAGILETGSIENTSLEQYDRIMNTNVRSIYQLTMLAVPHLIATKGNIVNVSSVCGLRAFPNVLAYNISKSAIDQLTRCVALELALKGVRCNSINPGVIITEIHKRGGMDEQAYAAFLEHSRTTHALGRPGEVHEASSAIVFLASEGASFITGANLPVDGGRHAMCPR